MFCSLKCWLGFPNRIYVDNKFALDNLIQFYNGKRPIFQSVHRFEDKQTPMVSRIVNDHDSDLNWRIPYKEVKKLNDLAISKDIDTRLICSGGKGFHFYIMFKEEPLTDLTNSKIFSIQHSLRKYFNLQSCDEPLFGKKNLLIRIPTTKHIAQDKKSGKFIDNGNYCRYLTTEEFDKGLDHIVQLIKEPGELPPPSTTKQTLQDIIELVPNYSFREKSNGNLNIDLNPGGVLTPTLEAVGLPCLQAISKQPNPSHPERLELASWLKLQGYRDMAIVAYFRTLKWQVFDVGTSLANVASIKPRFPKCSFLRDRYPLCEKCSFKK